MKRAFSSRHLLAGAAIVALGFSLAGCDTIRQAAGLTKQPPDEFAIATKAPLIIPPDYNLRPPKPGAAPTNQASPTQDAQGTLFSADAPPPNLTGYSQGEQELLASAGADGANDSIRRQIATDNANADASGEDFSNEVLFWQGPPQNNGTPVNADAEAQRIQSAQTAGQSNPGGGDQGQTQQPSQQQQQQNDSDNDNNDSGSSWLDDLFNW